jgi:Bacterial pre-peptidase C-terminal domain
MAFVAVSLIAPGARAGGPLLVRDGKATTWARNAIVNPANPNLKTVDSQGRVLYRVDTGTLGTLSEEKATRYVDRIFKLYTDIPTATIEFVNAGRILDPTTGLPVNVNKSNFGRFASSRTPTYQNPIIFDSDGSITGDPRTLGFFGFLQVDQDSNTLREGVVVLNGASISEIGEIPFLGVFTHEFGHFAGPLDHSQINGNIAGAGRGSIPPDGFSRTQTFDLFTPFTETLFPFIFEGSAERTPGSSLRGQGFDSSGFFVASLDLDTQNALSNLYPTDDYRTSRGAIEGRVSIKAGSSDIPISGINIIARRISRGAYPPALGTQAFFNSQVTLDSDGVPNSPPDQDATDPLATAVSAVTGLELGAGKYRVTGLPPGDYLLELQQINPSAISGSGIGPLRNGQVSLPITAEYYNGPGVSSNTVSSFTPVSVSAGVTVLGIDFTINGLSTTLGAVNEKEEHFKLKKAQQVDFPVEISGRATGSDQSQFKMTLPDGSTDKIEDFYKITVTTEGIFFIVLEPVGGATGDLDMYLFDASTVAKKKSSLDDTALEAYSAGPTADEIIGVRLVPGTYVIGVSAFENSALSYKLKIISSQ